MLEPRDFPDTRPSLLDTLRAGATGQSGWREFFQQYGPAVFRVARRRGLDEHDAEDLVQQVMLAIAGHIDDFEYDRDCGRFRQWVKTIANNKIRDLFRRRAAGPHVEPVADLDTRADEGPDLDELWEQEWRVQEILHCLDIVSTDFAPRRVEAFRLYVLEGLSAQETAQRLGMTRGHVYVTRAEVMARIRERIEQAGKNGCKPKAEMRKPKAEIGQRPCETAL
jgi:RNA polymerase sigma-70 factor (ECF subfamily)